MGLFLNREKKEGRERVPVWFMRQAGRYHQHYQQIRKRHSFIEMCKTPELACEITMGPIEEFGFDAAILFSDLLFPLEQLNLGLHYDNGPPELKTHLQRPSDLKIIQEAGSFYLFQAQAIALLRKKLPPTTDLLGFVGAPFTLYTYAVEGAHKGQLIQAKKGLYSGLFDDFCDALMPELMTEMSAQAQNQAQAICLFDTAAGELSLRDYLRFIKPRINALTHSFKRSFPQTKIVYYLKHGHLDYLAGLEDDCIDVFGIDWRMNLADALNELGQKYYIQGNLDPALLHLSWQDLDQYLEGMWSELKEKKVPLNKWIMGLGHGVLPKTPEQNVKKTVEKVKKQFWYDL